MLITVWAEKLSVIEVHDGPAFGTGHLTIVNITLHPGLELRRFGPLFYMDFRHRGWLLLGLLMRVRRRVRAPDRFGPIGHELLYALGKLVDMLT